MNVFIYGTLLVPRIWKEVTGCEDARSEPASLSRHRIFRVDGGDFPGIIEDPVAPDPVPGRVVFGVSEEIVRRLDAYEDDFYERISVRVDTGSGPVEAHTYRVRGSEAAEILTAEPWTLEWFEGEALGRYWERVFGGG